MANLEGVKIYRWDAGAGQHVEADEAWLSAAYGPVSVQRSQEQTAWRLAALLEKWGESSLTIKLKDEGGAAVADTPVIFWFSTADPLPSWTPPPEPWTTNGVQGRTGQNGDVGFGMGGGAYYFPPNKGPHAVWVGQPGVGTDFVEGLGMLGGTNHNHVEPVFQRVQGEEPPEPPPEPPEPPEPADDVLEALARIEAILVAIHGLLQGGYKVTPS